MRPLYDIKDVIFLDDQHVCIGSKRQKIIDIAQWLPGKTIQSLKKNQVDQAFCFKNKKDMDEFYGANKHKYWRITDNETYFTLLTSSSSSDRGFDDVYDCGCAC